MNYVSLFSGIEAATVAWNPLRWTPLAFAEVDPYCCELLDMRYHDVPNLGDITKIDWKEYAGSVDLVVGGSPCQAFSTAGNRRGLMDERGRLMFEYIRAVRDLRPRWLLWENVPGVLSQSNGDAFGTLIRELSDCGYRLAWRILDAQFFGVAQRRRRVFVVGHHRVGCAAAVLFERESLRWDFASSREKRASLTGDVGAGAAVAIRTAQTPSNGWGVSEELTHTLDSTGGDAVAVSQYGDIAGTLTARYNSSAPSGQNVVAFQYGVASDRSLEIGDTAPTIKTVKPPAVCLAGDNSKSEIDKELAPTMRVGNANRALIVSCGYRVRRLMPVECERLQGFPDGYTQLGDTKDAPRYRALGNSMAVSVMRWIGERIAAVDTLIKSTPHDATRPISDDQAMVGTNTRKPKNRTREPQSGTPRA